MYNKGIERKTTKMYMKDLKHKMTLRLNDELKEYVEKSADRFCVSPSDFIRQCIVNYKDAQEKAERIMSQIPGNIYEGLKMEGFENGTDRKADKHDKL